MHPCVHCFVWTWQNLIGMQALIHKFTSFWRQTKGGYFHYVSEKVHKVGIWLLILSQYADLFNEDDLQILPCRIPSWILVFKLPVWGCCFFTKFVLITLGSTAIFSLFKVSRIHVLSENQDKNNDLEE